MKRSMKIIAVIALALMVIPCTRSEAARSRRKSSKSAATKATSQTAQKVSGLNSLPGVWKCQSTGTGTGTDPRQPGVDVSLNADEVTLTIESVRYSESEGEGRADVIFSGIITDIRSEIICERSWEYSVPYNMKRESDNSWSFSTEYIDGEEKITLTLMGGKNALIRWEGYIANEIYPDEKYTFDVTCSAVKK
mgnify:CR=1 FL=1